MRQKTGWIIQVFAMFVVLLHSIVPHQHLANNNSFSHIEEHETASTWIDFIALGFHHQQVEGDLENFAPSNPSDQVDFQPEFVCFTHLHFYQFTIADLTKNKTYSTKTVTPLFEDPFSGSSYRRGPPILFV